jgi:HipA-like protein
MPIRRFIEVAKDWLGAKTIVHAPAGISAQFLLRYGDLTFGTLSVKDGLWQFEYSEEFRRSEHLRPLIEFPDPDKVYQSSDLWQFFAMRIPSAERPEIEEILRRENIPEDDAVRLLKRFGKRTIANPFELLAA